MSSRKKPPVFEIVLFALCAVYFIGALTFLFPCGPKEDGSFMTCHWAGQALRGVSCLMAVVAALALATRNDAARRGLVTALIPAGALTAALPGRLIGLCMMNSMTCQAVTRPAALVFGLLIAALALADALRLARSERQATAR